MTGIRIVVSQKSEVLSGDRLLSKIHTEHGVAISQSVQLLKSVEFMGFLGDHLLDPVEHVSFVHVLFLVRLLVLVDEQDEGWHAVYLKSAGYSKVLYSIDL